MMTDRGTASPNNKYLESLRARHAALEEQIHQEQKVPAPNMAALRDLKRQKLRIKEEIEGASGA